MKKYTLISGFLDRERELIIAPDHIAFENKDTIGDTFTKLLQQDVVALKYKVDAIVWYEIRVGKKFTFALKDKHGKELHVVVKNHFGLRRNFNLLRENITTDLWNYFLIPVADQYLKTFYEAGSLTLGSLTFAPSGIQTPTLFFLWRELAVQEYYSYFAIYKIDNPNLNHRVGFDEWDAEVLLIVVRTILKEKKPDT